MGTLLNSPRYTSTSPSASASPRVQSSTPAPCARPPCHSPSYRRPPRHCAAPAPLCRAPPPSPSNGLIPSPRSNSSASAAATLRPPPAPRSSSVPSAAPSLSRGARTNLPTTHSRPKPSPPGPALPAPPAPRAGAKLTHASPAGREGLQGPAPAPQHSTALEPSALSSARTGRHPSAADSGASTRSRSRRSTGEVMRLTPGPPAPRAASRARAPRHPACASSAARARPRASRSHARAAPAAARARRSVSASAAPRARSPSEGPTRDPAPLEPLPAAPASRLARSLPKALERRRRACAPRRGRGRSAAMEMEASGGEPHNLLLLAEEGKGARGEGPRLGLDRRRDDKATPGGLRLRARLGIYCQPRRLLQRRALPCEVPRQLPPRLPPPRPPQPPPAQRSTSASPRPALQRGGKEVFERKERGTCLRATKGRRGRREGRGGASATRRRVSSYSIQ